MATRGGAGLWERLLASLGLCAVLLPLLLLLCALGELSLEVFERRELGLLPGFPWQRAEHAAILPGLVGSCLLLALTALFALPIGVGAALYLEEYGKHARIGALLERNIAQLADVPSVIYGLIGLAVFVRTLGLGRSVIAGAATLVLLVLPVVISSAREALRGVPDSLREACFALGASRWQTLRGVILPLALPGILGGATRALGRALGEAAALIVLGALSGTALVPGTRDAPLSALPLQVFSWVVHPQEESLANAAAGCLLLLGMTLLLHLLAAAFERGPRRRLR
jgi:phosphate transport system permease protein